jgi:hypothetical protein
MKQGSWVEQARCALPEYRNLEWVMEKPGNQTKSELSRKRQKMAEVCNLCPVMAECREYAEKAHVTIGFWAGKNFNFRFSVER